MLFLSKARRVAQLCKSTLWIYKGNAFNFGLISEYNERSARKLNNNHSMPDKPQFFVTSARPGNFGDHIDFKTNLDNWFDENRVHNEH
jgi:ubiquinol-cytochrome c reductase iron-sulfur subunit